MTAVDSGRRLLLLAVIFALLGSALVVRLGYWQVSQRDRLVESARQQIYVRSTEPSKRGDIYDRDGKPVATQGGMEWIQQRVKADTDTYAQRALPLFKPAPTNCRIDPPPIRNVR